MIDKFQNREITSSVYSVGNVEVANLYQTNAYLITDKDSLLINSGSLKEAEYVIQNVERIININSLKYIIISNLDIDDCSGLNLILDKIPNIIIITSKYFIDSLSHIADIRNYYFIEEHNFQFDISNDNKFIFLPNPYLKHPGTFMVYSEKAKILFSGILFSGLNKKYELYSNTSYIKNFTEFQEYYFFDSFLVKNIIDKIREFDIKFIAPSKGSIIRGDCSNYLKIFEHINLGSIYYKYFRNSFRSAYYLSSKSNEEIKKIEKENLILKEEKDKLTLEIKKFENMLLTNKLTGLYNGLYFIKTLKNTIKDDLKNKRNYSLIVVDIDDLMQINFDYGNDIGDEVLKYTSDILKGLSSESHYVYKLKGAAFAYFIKNENDNPLEISENIRNNIYNSKKFIRKINVSLVIVSYNEFFDSYNISPENLVDDIIDRAYTRLKIVKSLGTNLVFEDSMIKLATQKKKGNILICDFDLVTAKTMRIELVKKMYKVYITSNGEEALEIIKNNQVDIIFSSIMLNKIDGFQLKNKLNVYSSLRIIPFILIDYNKTEDTIKRCYSLKIDFFLQKPVFIEEIVKLSEKYIGSDLEDD